MYAQGRRVTCVKDFTGKKLIDYPRSRYEKGPISMDLPFLTMYKLLKKGFLCIFRGLDLSVGTYTLFASFHITSF